MPSLKGALWGLAFGLGAVALYHHNMIPGMDRNQPAPKKGA